MTLFTQFIYENSLIFAATKMYNECKLTEKKTIKTDTNWGEIIYSKQ